MQKSIEFLKEQTIEFNNENISLFKFLNKSEKELQTLARSKNFVEAFGTFNFRYSYASLTHGVDLSYFFAFIQTCFNDARKRI